MKAVVIKKPGQAVLEQVEIPKPHPGFALIKVKASAICATDLEVLDGNIPAKYPVTPGHEWSGIVTAVGRDEDSHWIGKRVVGSNDVVCLTCDACRSGNWRYCEEFEEIGFKRNAGRFAETLAPEYEEAKAHLGSMARCEEDVLSYIAFPQQAEQYFQRRENTFTASYTIKEVG